MDYGGRMDTTPIRTIPHFTVTAADGGTVDYAKDIWQRKNLVLIAVPSGGDERELSRTYASVAAEDTRLIVTSSSVAGVSPPAVVVADHLLRGLLWPESVYGVLNPEWWRFLEHAFWVVFEDVFLVIGCSYGLRELLGAGRRQAEVETLRETDQIKSFALEMALAEARA